MYKRETGHLREQNTLSVGKNSKHTKGKNVFISIFPNFCLISSWNPIRFTEKNCTSYWTLSHYGTCKPLEHVDNLVEDSCLPWWKADPEAETGGLQPAQGHAGTKGQTQVIHFNAGQLAYLTAIRKIKSSSTWQPLDKLRFFSITDWQM